MTEDKWFACQNPDHLLDYVQDQISDRKLRLFVCACVRMVWDLLIDDRSRRAVDCGERLANGHLSYAQTRNVGLAARSAELSFRDSNFRGSQGRMQAYHAARAAALTLVPNADLMRLGPTFCELAQIEKLSQLEPPAAVRRRVRSAQSRLLRCLVGNPFRPMYVEPRCLVWNGGIIVKIAQRIDESRNYGHLPVLADALEEAGCSNEVILEHCREGTTHAKGCHVLDCILSRE
ncbi:MAG: hypothetical protein ACFCD0_15570 [Gemmataceae bacterium]